MGHTSQVLADPYISTGLTTVKGPFTYTPVVQAAGSFDMMTFTSPFVWDGSSNIVINICTGSNPFTSPYGGLRTYAATLGSVRHIRTDGTTSNCGTATATNLSAKPNIQFTYTPPVPCSGIPSPGQTLSTTANACTGSPCKVC